MRDLSDPSLLKQLENYKIVGECHFYQGFRAESGHPRYSVSRGKEGYYYLHRLALALKLGKTYEELRFALHKCNNPPCINVNHLYEGGPSENAQDLVKAGGNFNSNRTHCPYGHEYTTENTYWHNNQRKCKLCRQRVGKAYREKYKKKYGVRYE